MGQVRKIENKWNFPNRDDIKKELNLFKKDNVIWKKIKKNNK